MIESESESAVRAGYSLYREKLTNCVINMQNDVKIALAGIEANIDFPEEGIEETETQTVRECVEKTLSEIDRLLQTYHAGSRIKNGVKVALVGSPNTGKSSLLNRLCGEDRAIVTDIAGTTRDVVTETVRLGDMILRLSDTAGIRESEDTVEKIGIEKSRKAIEESGLVLAVFDSSRPLDDDDKTLINAIKESDKSSKTVCIVNKTDIACEELDLPFDRIIKISARNGEGIDSLVETVSQMFGAGEISENDEIVVNARQCAAVANASESLESAINALDGFTQDIAGMDIERALSSIAEADGRLVSEDIVNEIFSRFCVGK
jgi:tRNA modification GTPase